MNLVHDQHRKQSAVFLHISHELKLKLRKQFQLQQHQKNKIIRNKFNHGSVRLVHWKLQNAERN